MDNKTIELEVEDYKEDKECKYRNDICEVCILKRCFRAFGHLVDAYEEDKK